MKVLEVNHNYFFENVAGSESGNFLWSCSTLTLELPMFFIKIAKDSKFCGLVMYNNWQDLN